MTYRELERKAVSHLEAAGIEDAKVDARLLLLYVSEKSAATLLMNQAQEVSDEIEKTYAMQIQKRCQRIPLQQIVGETEFMGLPFFVSEDVLCPRQDTEILVEEVLRCLKDGDEILDLCAGSGCIGISLMKLGEWERRHLTLDGADLSEKALAIAEKNALRNGLKEECFRFYQGDLFDAIEENRRYDVIVSNPPYIPSEDIKELMPEVKDHEPLMALDGKEDGLFFYRRITQQAASHLKEGGWLCYEIGYDQGESVAELMMQSDYKDVRVIQDLSGNDRVVMGHL